MMVAATSSLSSAELNDHARKLFTEDDEETLSLLVSTQDHEIPDNALESLTARFIEDHNPVGKDLDINSTWNEWITKLNTAGFSVSISRERDGSSRSSESPSSEPIPLALQNDRGKLHLDATIDLLSVSKVMAVQLTLAVIRSINASASVLTESSDFSNSEQFKSLLGTRALLEKIAEYYYKQRVARLSVIAELLRLEQQQELVGNDKERQNQTNNIIESIDLLLGPIDKLWTIQGKSRGIFRIFLFTSCQPEESLTWTQLMSAEKLDGIASRRKGAPTCLSDEFGGDDMDREEWKQFMRDAINRKRLFSQRERLEALEGLLILLYNRIEGGVTRSDLAMLLIAFDSQNYFRSNATESFPKHTLSNESINRLPSLAGLIIVESLSLWRILDVNNPNWMTTHPVFESDDSMLVELESLTKMIERSCVDKECNDFPESLALLGFGLLLHAAGEISESNSLSTIYSTGMTLALKANNELNAFTYLLYVMESLVVGVPEFKRLKMSSNQELELFGEILYDTDSLQILKPDQIWDYGVELSATSLAYACIGRELLTVTIHSFQSKLLPADMTPNRENVKLLTMLVAAIFQSSPTMCQPFWAEWEAYTMADAGKPSPMCLLLKGAHTLASLGVSDQMSDEESILCIMPFLQMVTNLSHNVDTVETFLSVIPQGMIRFTVYVLASRSSAMHKSTTLQNFCEKIVDSISTLARIGDSPRCRDILRIEIDGGADSTSSNSGVNNLILLTVSSLANNGSTITKVFNLISALLVDAPVMWVCEVIKNMKFLQDAGQLWYDLFIADDSAARATVVLIHCLVKTMGKVLFYPAVTEQGAIEFLAVLRQCIHASSSLLLMSLSQASRRSEGEEHPSYLAPALTLECISDTLMALRQIVKLHQSTLVQSAATEFLESVIQSLASRKGLGESVFSYAVAPVTITIANQLLEFTRESNFKSLTASNDKQDIFQPSSQGTEYIHSRASVTTVMHEYCTTFVSKMSINEIALVADNLSGWQDCCIDDTVFCAALSAIRLLNSWVMNVEEKSEYQGIAEEETANKALISNPITFLTLPGTSPRELRMANPLSSFCSSGVSFLSLLLVYMRNPEKEETGWKSLMTMQVLDFMSKCLYQGEITSKALAADVLLSRSLYESTMFVETVAIGLADVLAPAQTERLSLRDKLRFGVSLRTIRVISAYFDANPSLASKTMNLLDGAFSKQFFDVIKGIPSILQSTKAARLSQRSPMMSVCFNLRMGIGCLNLIRNVWKCARNNSRSEYWRGFTGQNSMIISEIASIVFNNSDLLSSSRDPASNPNPYQCLLLTCLSISLDFLSIEISWSRSLQKMTEQVPIVLALERSLEGSLSNIIPCVRYLTRMSSFRLYSEACKSLSSHIALSPCTSVDSIVENFTTFTCNQEFAWIVEGSAVDTIALSKWFYDITKETLTSSEAATVALNMEKLQSLYSCEARCLVRCNLFLQSLSLLLKESNGGGCWLSMLKMSEKTFYAEMLQSVLQYIHENLLHFGELDDSPGFLELDALSLTKKSVGLLLVLVQYSVPDMDEGNWARSLKWSCKIAGMLAEKHEAQTSIYFLTLRQVFVVVITLLRLKPSGQILSNVHSQDEIEILRLARRACDGIVAVQTSAVQTDESVCFFCTCLAFFASLLECANVETTFSSNLCQLLQESGVMLVLVKVVTELSAGREGVNGHPPNRIANDDFPLLSTLVFFTRLASTGQSSSLLLLGSNDSLNLLWIKDKEEKLFEKAARREGSKVMADQISDILKAKMLFVASCLRSLNLAKYCPREISFAFIRTAVDFVRVHEKTFFCSLKMLSSVGDAKPKALTPKLLNDADTFLSIVVELCSYTSFDFIQQECHDIFASIREYTLQMVIKLGNFLGASAAAREIFRATEQKYSESNHCFNISGQYSSSFPSPRMLTGGMQNMNHEAIRYSHFVSTMSQNSSFTKKIGSAKTGNTNSLSSLENACRQGVTRDFAHLELQVCTCLSTALKFLWKIHPASSCYVSFSAKEASQLEAMRLVRTGTMIGFRGNNLNALFAFDEFNGDESRTDENILFGQVLRCDTVRRQWHVQVDVNATHQVVVVEDRQLAGIEDVTKRTPLLSYSAAPDSAAAMDSVDQKPSIGHLILALRWCSQFHSEIQSGECNMRSVAQPATLRLAELSAAFLCTELSIREEIERRRNPSEALLTSNDSVIASQVLGLFGDESDFRIETRAALSCSSNFGRLKHVLRCNSSWDLARNQLREYINAAVIDLVAKAPFQLNPSFAA